MTHGKKQEQTAETAEFEEQWNMLMVEGLSPAWGHLETITPKTYGLVQHHKKSAPEPTEAPESAPAMLDSLHGFQPLHTLGEGGMGLVYLAHQSDLHREVALKQIKPTQHSPKAVRALLREARITGALQHPNITPIYALGNDQQGHPIMVMKRIEGASWRELLEDDDHPSWGQHKRWGSDRLERHLEILMEVCDAVHFAHSKGLLHRDLKPANVMIGDFGEVVLLDWGIAYPMAHAPAHLLEDDASPDEPRRIVGTPAYMAPEMAMPGDKQHGQLTPATDVYLLGAILYEILVGAPLHRGGSLREVLFSIFCDHDDAFPPDLPPPLVGICQKATQKKPQDRYQDVMSFQEAIANFLRHRGSISLTQTAQATLEQLKADIDWLTNQADESGDEARRKERQGSLQSHFARCQQSFASALQIWPDNEPAKEGLEEAISTMFYRAVQTRNEELARGLYQELKAPTDKHEESLQQLIHSIIEEEKRKQTYQQMVYDSDLTIAYKQRIFMMSGMGVVLAIVGVFMIMRARTNAIPPSYEMSLLLHLIMSLGSGALLFAKRRALLQNKINRHFVFMFFMVIAGSFVSRLGAYTHRFDLYIIPLFDFLIVGLVGLMGAFTFHKGYLWITAICFLAFTWVSHTQSAILTVFPLVLLGCWLVIFVIMLRTGPAQKSEES